MPKTNWRDFILHLLKVFTLLVLLAFLLPKLAWVCQIWISSLSHNQENPSGYPMRVEAPWSDDVIRRFP